MCLFERNSDENTNKGKGHAVLHTQVIDCPPGTNTLIRVKTPRWLLLMIMVVLGKLQS